MRNSHILAKSLKTFFLASVLSSAVTQLNILVDGIVVSHAVDKDAISAINLSAPVLALVMLVASMIYNGAGILMGNAIGNQKYDSVNKLYTVAIIFVIVINLLIAIVCCCCVDAIAGLLTSEKRLLPLLTSYLPVSFIGALFISFHMAMANFVRVSGRPTLVTKCMVTESVGNAVLDLLFVVVFGWGMYGAAAASASAAFFSTAVFIPYLKSPDRPFSLVKMPFESFFKVFVRELRRGFPIALGTLALAAMMISVNALVLRAKGADGMFVFSVCMQILMLSMLLLGGGGQVITGIGGILLGEYDYEALKKVFTIVFKVIVSFTLISTVIVFAFPELLAQLFGAKGRLLQESIMPLRQFSLIFLPLGIIIPLSNVLVLLNRNTIASIINVGMLACIVPIVFLSTLFFPDYIWLSMSISMWIVLLASVASVFTISKRHKGLHWLFLTPKADESSMISVSVKYDRADASAKVDEVMLILESRGLDRCSGVKHCLEEVLVNEVEHGIATGRQDGFDVFSSFHDGKVTIILKSVGAPFNPLNAYDGQDDMEKIRMDIVKGYSSDNNYKYMNGVNCLYINIDTKL